MKSLIVSFAAAVLLLNTGCESRNFEQERSGAFMRRTENVAANSRDSAVEFAAEKSARRSRSNPRSARAVGTDMARDNFRTPAGHQMAFTAHLRLSVSNVREAVNQARELALKLGGYVKRMDDNSAVLAIPSAQADRALAELKKFGVLLSLRIEGEDVTQRVTDLAVRLENLEKSRQRLLALLEKAGKVEEMVKVENAITRVTSELELLQAQQKNLRNRIDYVTMYVSFAAAVSKPAVHHTAPVGWVNSLGENLLAFDQQIVNNGDDLIIGLKLPDGFVKNGTDGAVSGNNCILELSSYVNAVTATHWYGNDYAGIEFYAPMIEKALKERFKVPVAVSRCKIDGYDAVIYTVKPEIGKVSYTYRAAVAVVKSRVKVIVIRARSSDLEKALSENAWNKMLESVRF